MQSMHCKKSICKKGDEQMKVMKFGGSSLKNAEDFQRISKIIKDEKDKKIVILSAVNGVTNTIQRYLNSGKNDEKAIKELIHYLQKLHMKISSESITNQNVSRKVQNTIRKKLEKLERLLYGVAYVGELTDRTRDSILSYGERLSAPILEGILNDAGIKAEAFEADSIGIITDGDFGNATAILTSVTENVRNAIVPLTRKNIVPIITGFFGCNSNGHTTTFGRNGSDYSASIIAYAVDADKVELWKDVRFMSADPHIVKDARLVDELSYAEAAELAYFGAKILHPRAVEPLMKKEIKLQIKNTYNQRDRGTKIGKNGRKKKELVKSVAHSRDIACIKIHGSGVGYKPGVLSEIVSHISSHKINITSVITSQTCITILLENKDLDRSYDILAAKQIKTVEKLEKIRDIALIAIVGKGILEHHGIAAKVFSAVAKKGINIEMISAGASDVAYYFLVKERYLESAIVAIHNEFFILKK